MDNSSLTTWLAIVRAVHFASCLLIAGVWMFDRLVVRDKVPPWRRLAIATLLIATPLALVSGAAWFVLVAANMSDLPVMNAIRSPKILKLVWSHTQFGRAWQIHLLIWLVGSVAAGAWAAFGRGQWVAALLSVALVSGLAWAGHGSTGPLPAWHLTIDITHLVAASAWPAGLVPLGLLVPAMIRSDDSSRWLEISNIVRRFSAMSLIAVGSLILTGLFNTWCLLGSFAALFASPYGRVLLIKLILFVSLLSLGAVNLLMLKPRLVEGALPVRRLLRNVLIEIVLGTAVVAAVGLLGLREPGRSVDIIPTLSSHQ